MKLANFRFGLKRLLFRALSIPPGGPEISDRIVTFDSDTLVRRPVSQQALVSEFQNLNNKCAARIVANLPAGNEGNLDPHTV